MRICAVFSLVAVILLAGCSSQGSSARTYQMGEKLQVGKLIYNVFDTQWLTHVGEGPTARIPENRFFLVRMSVTNSGGSEVSVPGFVITDDSGKTYQELQAGEGFPNWIGFLRNLKPADTLQGNAVFDAPPGHYKLKVTDDSEQNVAYVELPLSFTSETPEVAVPGAPKQ